MDEQVTLFDWQQAQAARDAALAQVAAHAEPDWREQALEAVRRTAERLAIFTVDDVWDVGELPATRENRAVGAVMLRAARLGWIRATHRFVPTTRVASHGCPRRQWESLIYVAAGAA